MRPPPKSNVTDTRFPYTTLFRSVHRDELDALEADLDHAVDSVDTAATDADDLDHGQVVVGGRHGAPSSPARVRPRRSEEHTSELQSLMRISYAVFCLKKKRETH